MGTDDIAPGRPPARLRSRRNRHVRVEPDVMGTRPGRAGPSPHRAAAAAAAAGRRLAVARTSPT